MRSLFRGAVRPLFRDAVALSAAMIAVGASFGAIAVAAGLPWWVPVLMSTAVFAGGAQFLAVGLLAAGNPLAAVFAGLLLNTRHLPFGLAVAGVLGVLLGGSTGNPDALGLDAAFPAGLIALILPSLRDPDTRRVALAGAAVAVLVTPVLPAGLPVLCALLGLTALLLPRRAPSR